MTRGWFQIKLLLQRHFRKAHKLSTHPATMETQCIEQTSVFFEFSWLSLLAVRFSATTATYFRGLVLLHICDETPRGTWSLILAFHLYSIIFMRTSNHDSTHLKLSLQFWTTVSMLYSLTHKQKQTHTISCQSSSNGCIIVGKPQMSFRTRGGRGLLNFISVEVCVHKGEKCIQANIEHQ